MRENLIPPGEAAEIVKFQTDHREPAVDGHSQASSAGDEPFCVVGVGEQQLGKNRRTRGIGRCEALRAAIIWWSATWARRFSTRLVITSSDDRVAGTVNQASSVPSTTT